MHQKLSITSYLSLLYIYFLFFCRVQCGFDYMNGYICFIFSFFALLFVGKSFLFILPDFVFIFFLCFLNAYLCKFLFCNHDIFHLFQTNSMEENDNSK